MTYDVFLTSNLLWVTATLAVIGGLFAWHLAKRLPEGWAMGIVGVPLVIVSGVVLSALNVMGWLVAWGGGRVLEPLTADPAGGVAFYWESGIEFGLLGIAIAVIVYAIARFRGRRRAVPA